MTIVFIRSILLYFLIILSVRLMGKRQLGELQPSELVITILISNIATLPIEDPSIPMLMGIIPIFILMTMEIIMSNLTLKFKSLRKLISGSPKIIIRNGVLDQKIMKKLRYSIDDVMESLRAADVFDIREVQFAVVETTGNISVYQKFNSRNTTPEMLGIKGKTLNPPQVIINDGKIDYGALNEAKIGLQWLHKTLNDNHIRLKDVFLLASDSELNYYIIPKE